MLNYLWLIFKFILSFLMVVVAAAALYSLTNAGTNIQSPLLVASICLILAAAPWLTSPKAMKNNALAAPGLGILFGVGFAAMAAEEFQGLAQHPSVCSGKNALMCHFTNWLYQSGGGIAVGSFYSLVSASVFLIVIAVLVKRANKT